MLDVWGNKAGSLLAMLRRATQNAREGRVPNRLQRSIVGLTLLQSRETFSISTLSILNLPHFHLQSIQIFR